MRRMQTRAVNHQVAPLKKRRQPVRCPDISRNNIYTFVKINTNAVRMIRAQTIHNRATNSTGCAGYHCRFWRRCDQWAVRHRSPTKHWDDIIFVTSFNLARDRASSDSIRHRNVRVVEGRAPLLDSTNQLACPAFLVIGNGATKSPAFKAPTAIVCHTSATPMPEMAASAHKSGEDGTGPSIKCMSVWPAFVSHCCQSIAASPLLPVHCCQSARRLLSTFKLRLAGDEKAMSDLLDQNVKRKPHPIAELAFGRSGRGGDDHHDLCARWLSHPVSATACRVALSSTPHVGAQPAVLPTDVSRHTMRPVPCHPV